MIESNNVRYISDLLDKYGGDLNIEFSTDNHKGFRQYTVKYRGVPLIKNKQCNLRYIEEKVKNHINNLVNKYDIPSEKTFEHSSLEIKMTYYNHKKRTTTVVFKDGIKVTVKASATEEFNEYAGLTAAIAKRIYNNNSYLKKKINEAGVIK